MQLAGKETVSSELNAKLLDAIEWMKHTGR
jgi:hypothetical protein